jgi:hypothetical protein
MAKSKKTATVILPAAKKSIVQWCKDQADQGNELTMKWEGGGDSGWVYFEIDGDSTDNEYTRALVDQMDTTLDYGSWAGEFNASGTATYDAEKNAFEGTDYYGEDESEVLDVDFTVRVPKKLWFDTLHVEVESNYDEGPQMSVRTLIKNGFLSDQHTEFCSTLEEVLKDEFEATISNYESNEGYEFRSCTDSWILERADAVESGDDLLFYIKQVDISVMTNDEKSIVLELDEETAAGIDNILNEKENAE